MTVKGGGGLYRPGGRQMKVLRLLSTITIRVTDDRQKGRANFGGLSVPLDGRSIGGRTLASCSPVWDKMDLLVQAPA